MQRAKAYALDVGPFWQILLRDLEQLSTGIVNGSVVASREGDGWMGDSGGSSSFSVKLTKKLGPTIGVEALQ